MDNLTVIRISGLYIENLFDLDLMNKYRISANNVATIYEHFKQLFILKDAVVYTAEIFKDQPTINDYIDRYNDMIPLYQKIIMVINYIIEDINYLQQAISSFADKIDLMTLEDKRFLWWWNGLPIFGYVFK